MRLPNAVVVEKQFALSGPSLGKADHLFRYGTELMYELCPSGCGMRARHYGGCMRTAPEHCPAMRKIDRWTMIARNLRERVHAHARSLEDRPLALLVNPPFGSGASDARTRLVGSLDGF